MSKSLNSILSKRPSATPNVSYSEPKNESVSNNNESKLKKADSANDTDKKNLQKENQQVSKSYEGKKGRIVADVPFDVKIQIKRYLIDHPEDTEKTVILKALKALGFIINENDLLDQRGKTK
ncbi:MAG: hypothetical protein J0H68_09715 [Sphingobacteriia bacterium]|nr:hypothetical protein [Sphingobacteriia bacterium]